MDDEVTAWLQRTREWCARLEADADSCLPTTAREDMPPGSALVLPVFTRCSESSALSRAPAPRLVYSRLP